MSMCYTMGAGGGIVLTTGTNLSYGQNRSQITGSDTPLPTFKIRHSREPEPAEETKPEQ